MAEKAATGKTGMKKAMQERMWAALSELGKSDGNMGGGIIGLVVFLVLWVSIPFGLAALGGSGGE